ncbi:hypothetical protein DMB42_50510 [Nonomuraea sp. WAC 01424]|uniref:hypothetical protein n=1 Tax=Nonomuraea sp. WAC 01424 TaxID=2203200 RepID=UPI000F7948FC|nr:hypothetical protein [Nonomuraea sp. WAC 01424]RSM94864.1 hypothetical protein DMB42_50510 [Nonomuraea sp. WAC 01424]
MATAGAARIDVERVLEQEREPVPPGRAEQVAGALPAGVFFTQAEPVGGGPGREPDARWELTSAWRHKGRFASGTAAVHLAAGHRALVQPMIFADGFGHGPSDLAGLWNRLDAPYPPHGDRLLSRLLAQGIDVVLLGFAARHTHIQANAGVAARCVHRAISERLGAAPLIVGGLGAGGLVTRYALAEMERRREDHQTMTYLSYDCPHNGAWIPLILQQLAYFAEQLAPAAPGRPGQADLIRSPAAQQLLWGWVGDGRYSGPVATASPLRLEFIGDLRAAGWFPARPRKLGVSNGAADGTGRNVPPDALAFEWSALDGLAGATVRTQPDLGTNRRLGGMRAVPMWASTSYTSDVAPFDGAPGGTLASYGMVADAFGAQIAGRFRSACFVPSVSAVALQYDPVDWTVDLYTDITALSPEQSELDDYQCDSDNSEHGTVTGTLADWILTHLSK